MTLAASMRVVLGRLEERCDGVLALHRAAKSEGKHLSTTAILVDRTECCDSGNNLNNTEFAVWKSDFANL